MSKRPLDSRAGGGVVPTNSRRMSPKPPKRDPRVRRTRQCFQQALLHLLREKPFNAITVQDLAERARLNRGTFYLHYRDKEQLLTQTMKDVLDELNALLRRGNVSQERYREGAPEVFTRWFQHVAEHSELYVLMLGPDGMASFAAQVRRYLERLMTPLIQEGLIGDSSGIPPVLRSRFLASAFLGVIAWWLEQERRQSPEQMAAWLWSLTSSLHWAQTP